MKLTNWEEIFDKDYYEYFQNIDNSPNEAEFIAKFLNLKKEDDILDIGCGNGRHLFQLHEKGFKKLAGIDFSENFIESAKERAKAGRFFDINFIQADFLQYEFGKPFDKAYSFFSGFGYFSDEQNEQYIKKVADSLRTGGLFLLDIFNYFYFVKNYQEILEVDKGDLHFLNKNSFNVELSTNEAENVITNKKTGQTKKYSYTMRYYNISEIKSMLAKFGLEIVSVFGDYEGNPINTQSKRAIFICRKMAVSNYKDEEFEH